MEIKEQEYFDNAILMVAMVKAGVELAFEAGFVLTCQIFIVLRNRHPESTSSSLRDANFAT